MPATSCYHLFMMHKILKTSLYILSGVGTGAFVTSLYLFRDSYKRMYRGILNRIFPYTIPDWKVVMSINHPSLQRPRFLSLHTIAALTGRNDLPKLIEEMRESCEVCITFCSTVKAPVFHLRSMDFHGNNNEPKQWNQLDNFLKKYPYPKYKGFKACEPIWSSGVYGMGRYTTPDTAMEEPFVRYDYPYAKKMIAALEKHQYEPGLKPYEVE